MVVSLDVPDRRTLSPQHRSVQRYKFPDSACASGRKRFLRLTLLLITHRHESASVFSAATPHATFPRVFRVLLQRLLRIAV
jgi:hypothetical protein